MCRDRRRHLHAVYGALNVPRALNRHATPAATATPQSQNNVMFTVPAALAPPAANASETLPEEVARLAQLVKAHALSQSHALPAFAAALPDTPGFDASESFWEFSERIVAAAVQRFYRPDGLQGLLMQLGVGEVGPKVLAMVRAALHEYAPAADKAAAATPLLKRIRCVSKIRCGLPVSLPAHTGA